MSNGFDPMDHNRPPRSEGWKNETEKIVNLIKSRGDQRIGQLILNAVRAEHGDGSIEEASKYLWNMEAPELLKLLKEIQNKTGEEEG